MKCRSTTAPLLLLVALVSAGGARADQILVGESNPLARDLPGQESVESLKKSLTVPNASSRWGALRPFGMELFRGSPEQGGYSPIEGLPVGPDYVLGPGDNLVVFISSLGDTSFPLTLDREGKVFLPHVGTTFLWGLPFADAESLIKSRLGSVLRNPRVQVSMGRLRALEVFVLGAVLHPGRYTLSGMATAFNALAVAGGPDDLGSLRDVRVLRANREIARLDLYPFLLDGDRSNDARLQSGDVVFVGPARIRVGVQGAVIRPAVYESPGPMTLRTLLRLAGGPSPFADLHRLRVERVDANGGFRLQDLPLDHGHGIDPDSLTLSDYDLVTLLPLNERVANQVTLDGFVRHPGAYELTPGMKLSELIHAERLLPEAALDHAELRRVDPASFQVEVRPFSVRKVWAGDGDVVLQPLDAVTVFSAARFPLAVSVEGEVVRPGVYAVTPGERLSDVLVRAGGVTARGYLPAAIFTRPSIAQQERGFLREFVQRQQLELAHQQAALSAQGDSAGASAVVHAQLELLQALERQSDPGRVALEIDPAGRWVGTARDPALEDGDRLLVPIRPATVTVLGSVMNPGTVMARSHGTVGDYLRLAGGPTRQADLSRSYVLKANGAAIPRTTSPRIEAGDAIVVPPRAPGSGTLGRSFAGMSRTVLELAATVAVVIAAARR